MTSSVLPATAGKFLDNEELGYCSSNSSMKRTFSNESIVSTVESGTDRDGAETAWRILDVGRQGKVSSQKFIEYLKKDGILLETDHRLMQVRKRLAAINGIAKDVEMNLQQFEYLTADDINFINRILEGKLVIPDFEDFVLKLEIIYEKVKKVKSGANASYIPELAKVNPDNFAISVCTVDGQRWSVGDYTEPFSIQSCMKPIGYLMALEEHGDEKVHHHVGTEPSGKEFNMLILKDWDKNPRGIGHFSGRKIPHNPMINAGAIMSCSLIMPNGSMAERFNRVMTTWGKLCGSRISFGNTVYLSEKATADRNWCLGYMMQEYKAFPKGSKLDKTLDFYFQCCSLEADCRQMAVMAATLANGGTSPLTGERIFQPKHVRNCLSIMLTSGMYDYSGEWAFSVGLPAKSGVGGCVYIVVPNILGLAVYSPPLDENGNSVKGILVAKELIKRFSFHQFDHLCATVNDKKRKINPTLRTHQEHRKNISNMLFAAANGDVREMDRLYRQGGDLFAEDYDARTCLHLACSEGHLRVIEYLLLKVANLPKAEQILRISPLDRWLRTPLDDAISSDQTHCAEFLRNIHARRGAGAKQNSSGFRVLNLKRKSNRSAKTSDRSYTTSKSLLGMSLSSEYSTNAMIKSFTSAPTLLYTGSQRSQMNTDFCPLPPTKEDSNVEVFSSNKAQIIVKPESRFMGKKQIAAAGGYGYVEKSIDILGTEELEGNSIQERTNKSKRDPHTSVSKLVK